MNNIWVMKINIVYAKVTSKFGEVWAPCDSKFDYEVG